MSDVGQQVGRGLRFTYEFADELKRAFRGFGVEIPTENGAPVAWELPFQPHMW
jgi:hypothetical protein